MSVSLRFTSTQMVFTSLQQPKKNSAKELIFQFFGYLTSNASLRKVVFLMVLS